MFQADMAEGVQAAHLYGGAVAGVARIEKFDGLSMLTVTR